MKFNKYQKEIIDFLLSERFDVLEDFFKYFDKHYEKGVYKSLKSSYTKYNSKVIFIDLPGQIVKHTHIRLIFRDGLLSIITTYPKGPSIKDPKAIYFHWKEKYLKNIRIQDLKELESKFKIIKNLKKL
jgi:hypothetical protein